MMDVLVAVTAGSGGVNVMIINIAANICRKT